MNKYTILLPWLLETKENASLSFLRPCRLPVPGIIVGTKNIKKGRFDEDDNDATLSPYFPEVGQFM